MGGRPVSKAPASKAPASKAPASKAPASKAPAPAPPSIVLLTADAPASVVRELCAGAEEQGVPIDVLPSSGAGRSLSSLAHSAAGRSRLEVGVAVDRSGAVVVHHATLPPECAVHELGPGAAPVHVRRAGQLAARLCTRMPLY
jgi:hypothetical protein